MMKDWNKLFKAASEVEDDRLVRNFKGEGRVFFLRSRYNSDAYVWLISLTEFKLYIRINGILSVTNEESRLINTINVHNMFNREFLSNLVDRIADEEL